MTNQSKQRREWWVETLVKAVLPTNRIARAFDADQLALGKECDPEFERRNVIHVSELFPGDVVLSAAEVGRLVGVLRSEKQRLSGLDRPTEFAVAFTRGQIISEALAILDRAGEK